MIRDPKARLGDVIGLLKVLPEAPGDDVIEHDLILVWHKQRRIITGSDLLGAAAARDRRRWRRRDRRRRE